MQDFNWTFDAKTVQPQQAGGRHPIGNKYPFRITDASVKENADKKGGRLEVEFTSEVGSIRNNYNLWNENTQAREIAQKQLSALCHAVGIFVIGPNKGKELIGGRGLMDVGFQAGQEPSAEKPEGGYVELKKVYDLAGNEPGKAPVAPTNQAQPQGGFGAQQQPQGGAPQAQSSNGAWGGAGAAQPQQQQPNPNPPQGGGGWAPNTTGAAPQTNPPWANG